MNNLSNLMVITCLMSVPVAEYTAWCFFIYLFILKLIVAFTVLQ